MTFTALSVQEFLSSISPFDQLSPQIREQLAAKLRPLRYRMGQAIVVRETMPDSIAILYSGQARLLGHTTGAIAPVTLQLLQPGAILGWASIVRGIPCETAIASTETICLTLPTTDFLTLIKQSPTLAAALHQRPTLIEVFELLLIELERQAQEVDDKLEELALDAVKTAVIVNLPPGKTPLSSLDPNLVWLVSGGAPTNFAVGSRLTPTKTLTAIQVAGSGTVRLLGLPPTWLSPDSTTPKDVRAVTTATDIPYAPDYPTLPAPTQAQARSAKYPYVRGRGPKDATLACFQMLSQHLGLPFRRDVLAKALANQIQRSGSISLQFCGAIGELMGLSSQLVKIPAVAVSRLPTPALLKWQDSFALVYQASDKELVLAIPETGIRRVKPAAFIETWGAEGEFLLLQQTPDTPKQRFGLSWFLPSVWRYRYVLLEVFVASFFVQLFGLANPLITQVIIDKVLVQNSIDTLNILGIFLIVVAVFEAAITSFRTNLFVDTTNRIDMGLGAQVIDHLLRLPLRYFERRPVGELATRVNELENIRQFLTGTALTVVLDAVFSVIYIAVMLFYSWLLTIVALATVPLFALLTLIVAPVIRQQSRTKAERNAETQSYLVEVVSGIQG